MDGYILDFPNFNATYFRGLPVLMSMLVDLKMICSLIPSKTRLGGRILTVSSLFKACILICQQNNDEQQWHLSLDDQTPNRMEAFGKDRLM